MFSLVSGFLNRISPWMRGARCWVQHFKRWSDREIGHLSRRSCEHLRALKPAFFLENRT